MWQFAAHRDSLARYVALLGPRELRQTIVASMIGRLPIGITGLAILLLVQTSTGSFARGDARAADGAGAHHSVHAGGEDGAGGAADRRCLARGFSFRG
jgi:hypothetical protein